MTTSTPSLTDVTQIIDNNKITNIFDTTTTTTITDFTNSMHTTLMSNAQIDDGTTTTMMPLLNNTTLGPNKYPRIGENNITDEYRKTTTPTYTNPENNTEPLHSSSVSAKTIKTDGEDDEDSVTTTTMDPLINAYTNHLTESTIYLTTTDTISIIDADGNDENSKTTKPPIDDDTTDDFRMIPQQRTTIKTTTTTTESTTTLSEGNTKRPTTRVDTTLEVTATSELSTDASTASILTTTTTTTTDESETTTNITPYLTSTIKCNMSSECAPNQKCVLHSCLTICDTQNPNNFNCIKGINLNFHFFLY